VPQAQAAQQRLKYTPVPQSYGQVINSSEVHRRECYLASVHIQAGNIFSVPLLICRVFFS
jgi:hypothetical protein